ncbi:MAG: hypothetical protein ABFD89_01645 [Bryobacteraceae bacterium]
MGAEAMGATLRAGAYAADENQQWNRKIAMQRENRENQWAKISADNDRRLAQTQFRVDTNRRAWAQLDRQAAKDKVTQENSNRDFGLNAGKFKYQQQQDADQAARHAMEYGDTQQRQQALDAETRRQQLIKEQQEYTPESFRRYQASRTQENPSGDPSLLTKRQAPSKAISQPGYWESGARNAGLDVEDFYDTDAKGQKAPSQKMATYLDAIDRLRELNPNASDRDLMKAAAKQAGVKAMTKEKATQYAGVIEGEIAGAQAEIKDAEGGKWLGRITNWREPENIAPSRQKLMQAQQKMLELKRRNYKFFLSPNDAKAYEIAMQNPNDPNAAPLIEKYEKQFMGVE